MNTETEVIKKCRLERFEKLLNTGQCQAVDVREPAEFSSERIEGVESKPLSRLGSAAVRGLHKDRAVYLLFRSGNRAFQAAERLKRLGFRDLYIVEGGMQEWIQAGKPIVRGPRHTWSLDRQARLGAGVLVFLGGLLSTVDPGWILLPVLIAIGLIFSAVTDTCGMSMILARMPWNREK
jgi:rhodanese-related sulfurtransferase